MIPVTVIVEKNTSNAMEKFNNIHVVIGVITNDKQQILLTQRGALQSFPFYWEFPGGKVEEGESPEDALIREMYEELGINVIECSFWHQFQHRYPSLQVMFSCYHIHQFTGKPILKEGQAALRYQSISKLSELKFPEANYHIISKLQEASVQRCKI